MQFCSCDLDLVLNLSDKYFGHDSVLISGSVVKTEAAMTVNDEKVFTATDDNVKMANIEKLACVHCVYA